jgi:transposase
VVLTDLHGFPLQVFVTPANHRDDKHALAFIDQLRALPDARGVVWYKPLVVQGDRGFGYCQVLLPLMTRGIFGLIPLAMDKCHGSGLGKIRYVVERTLAWFGCFRRLGKCFERIGKHLAAFHELAAALICLKKVRCVVSHF